MDKYSPEQPRQAESPQSPLSGFRNKIAGLMMLGATALPACKVAILNLEVDRSDPIRAAALDEDGSRIFTVPGADGVVHLSRVEKDEGMEIVGLLNLSGSSPISPMKLEPSCQHKHNPEYKQEEEFVYPLSPEAFPWMRVVRETSGAITLRAVNNQIVLLFDDCRFTADDANRNVSCLGAEIRMGELEENIKKALANCPD
jgi:hypothetical protein